MYKWHAILIQLYVGIVENESDVLVNKYLGSCILEWLRSYSSHVSLIPWIIFNIPKRTEAWIYDMRLFSSNTSHWSFVEIIFGLMILFVNKAPVHIAFGSFTYENIGSLYTILLSCNRFGQRMTRFQLLTCKISSNGNMDCLVRIIVMSERKCSLVFET